MAEYRIMNTKEFSVTQFFKTGGYEKVRQFVSAEEAAAAFWHYTNNVATKIGLVVRVIVTDGGDCINMEWERGKGITYPPPEEDPELTNTIKDYHTGTEGE
jgi:hypothetical protein